MFIIVLLAIAAIVYLGMVVFSFIIMKEIMIKDYYMSKKLKLWHWTKLILCCVFWPPALFIILASGPRGPY